MGTTFFLFLIPNYTNFISIHFISVPSTIITYTYIKLMYYYMIYFIHYINFGNINFNVKFVFYIIVVNF